MRRIVALWCPDWPVVAAGVDVGRPVVVRAADLVVACSPAARAAGIQTGLRRREAQARCPEVTIVEHDPARDARVFARVVAAVDDIVPDVAVGESGWLLFAVRGPARRMGGESAVVARLRAAVDTVLAELAGSDVAAVGGLEGPPAARVGVADGWFAAVVAARHAAPVHLVAPGQEAAFLSSMSVRALSEGLTDADEVIDLFERLGVRTLGALASLPRRDVADRFGAPGVRAHQLASGQVDDPLDTVTPEDSVECALAIDPPAVRADVVAFAARGVADQFLMMIARRSLLATVVAIDLETAHAERQRRQWRSVDGFTAAALVDRLRWQLDGWLESSDGSMRPTAGVSGLRFCAIELLPGGQQLTVTDPSRPEARRVAQTLARVQGMLGASSVLVGVPAAGRDPGSDVAAVPWRDDVSSTMVRESCAPWPGRLPPPAPTILPTPPPVARLVAADATPVRVSGRGELSAPPARVQIGTRPWNGVERWAGPWPVDERWWESTGRRRARLQIVTDAGAGLLLTIESGRWHVEAFYD